MDRRPDGHAAGRGPDECSLRWLFLYGSRKDFLSYCDSKGIPKEERGGGSPTVLCGVW